jgi:cell division protein FtsW
MGAGTFIKERLLPQNPARFVRGFDMPLLVAVVALIVFGLAMLYSASWDFSYAAFGDKMYLFNRQVMWLGLGLTAATILAFFDYHYWRRLVVPAMAVTVLMLFVVLLMSEIRFNAKRAVFDGSVQPSELAKLVSILYLSVWLYAKRQTLNNVSFGLIPLGVILGVVGGLIYQQPDLSAAATVLVLGGLLFFLAGGDLKQMADYW